MALTSNWKNLQFHIEQGVIGHRLPMEHIQTEMILTQSRELRVQVRSPGKQ
jgi:hypothetical protein